MRPDADLRWAEYVAPASNLAAAVQYPLDENWAGRVINGYLKDDKERRKQK